MEILKYEKIKTPKILKMKCKCPYCLTKVLLTDTHKDLVYVGYSWSMGMFTKSRYYPEFGYICPECNSTVKLSERKNLKICDCITYNYAQIKSYYEKCGMYFWGEFNNLSLVESDLSEYLSMGFPYPEPIYRRLIKHQKDQDVFDILRREIKND